MWDVGCLKRQVMDMYLGNIVCNIPCNTVYGNRRVTSIHLHVLYMVQNVPSGA